MVFADIGKKYAKKYYQSLCNTSNVYDFHTVWCMIIIHFAFSSHFPCAYII